MGWYEKYGPQGFVIIGIHSPEFAWERPVEKVESACADMGIKYPVALDNNFTTWKLYGTRYWPTLHLIDKNGIIRHTRYGEGGYAKMESMIQKLLRSRRSDKQDNRPTRLKDLGT